MFMFTYVVTLSLTLFSGRGGILIRCKAVETKIEEYEFGKCCQRRRVNSFVCNKRSLYHTCSLKVNITKGVYFDPLSLRLERPRLARGVMVMFFVRHLTAGL